jgi:hypothetical protein
MEPLHPELRAELKRAHPGLDDACIDEYETLTATRFLLDPERDKGQLAEIESARVRLLQARMPHYSKVREAFLARRRSLDSPERPAVKIEWRDEKDDPRSGAGRR